MNNSYSFQMKVSGEPIFVNVGKGSEPVIVQDENMHHVLVLDGSGSMHGVIKRVEDQAKAIINRIVRPDDVLTVILFRGQRDFDVLVREVPKLSVSLDDLTLRAGGTTCFSDPFAFVASLTQTNQMKTSITLLSDGSAVVPWSDEEELNNVIESIKKIDSQTELVAVNAIGYGYYYDREFLTKVTRVIGNGQFNHSDNIDKFFAQYEELDDLARDSSTKAFIQTNGNLAIHLTEKSVITAAQSLRSREVAGNNTFIFTSSTTSYDKVTQSSINESELDTVKYALALAYYEANNRMSALDIIVNSLRDKRIADKAINAFTREEVQDVVDSLRNATIYTTARFVDGLCSVGYLPKQDAYCVVDLFNDASTYGALYMPFHSEAQEYNRVTQKVTDNYNAFKAIAQDTVTASFDDVVWNADRLNLSVRFEIEGQVTLNPKQAKDNGLDNPYPAKMYRTHTFVKDGVLNINQIIIQTPNDNLLNVLSDNKVKYDILSNVDGKYFIKVNLSKLPMINRMYSSMEMKDIYECVTVSTQSEASVKVLKEYIEKIEEELPTTQKVGDFKKLNTTQIDILSSHGISDKGVYQGIDNTKDAVADADFYEARKLAFDLAGFSSWPTTKSIEEKLAAGKPLTKAQDMLKSQIDKCEAKLVELGNNRREFIKWARNELNLYRNIIRSNTAQLSAAKIAKVITKDWWTDTKFDDKGKEYFAIDEDSNKLMIKTSRTKVYV